MAFICSMCVAKAQDVLMATLQHGETMTAYYGSDAFKSAMAAAENGDLITLSGGVFNGTTIDKAVTIQGAGSVQDIANNRYRTSIPNGCTIDLPEDATGLTIEGIWSNNTFTIASPVTQMTVKRCLISILRFNGQTTNCAVLQCRIGNLYPDAQSQNMLIENSAIKELEKNSSGASMMVRNCLICHGGGQISPYSNDSYNVTASFVNCIIYNPTPSTDCSAYNIVYSNDPYGIGFQTNNAQNIRKPSDFKALFVGSSYSWDGNLRLTDEAAAQYLGDDGTQVGVYGGARGFTDVPSNPQVTSKEIAPQSDANGKLAVKITVEAQKD